uniref:Dynein light chain LC8-type 1 n=2 Tax=Anura TaxID=8342 RepID=A0A8C5M4Z1_9ANUR
MAVSASIQIQGDRQGTGTAKKGHCGAGDTSSRQTTAVSSRTTREEEPLGTLTDLHCRGSHTPVTVAGKIPGTWYEEHIQRQLGDITGLLPHRHHLRTSSVHQSGSQIAPPQVTSLGACCHNLSSSSSFASIPQVTMTDRKAVIKNADMSEEMQQDAVECATQALEKFNIEKDIAAYIKKEFDKKYNPTWHCIVGRNFGSYVTHETKHFIYFYLGQVAILLFKSG